MRAHSQSSVSSPTAMKSIVHDDENMLIARCYVVAKIIEVHYISNSTV